MAASFFFYDLETSGLSTSEARVMQFAGQRTNEELEPIGDPVNILIKLAADVLPSPEAVLITGITPQQTLAEGITEAEFLKFFYQEIVKPDTTFLGFNSVRFDDEFMRYMHYRNFYDPYEWHWRNNCSRWDILDLVRITRALRPEGITWPFTEEGKPTNRLELLTKLNGLEHKHAHDALSDVYATINVTKLIRSKQPDLFKYLFKCRTKREVTQLVKSGKPFVYTSGKYPTETLNTTVAVLLANNVQDDGGIVFDLRYDPSVYAAMPVEELVTAWRYDPLKPSKQAIPKPTKTLKFNKCPALAPIGVVNSPEIEERLQLSLSLVEKHKKFFKEVQTELAVKVLAAQEQLDAERVSFSTKVDSRLYENLINSSDKQLMAAVRSSSPDKLDSFIDKFSDERLKLMLPLYKARNFPAALTSSEREAWDAHIAECLFNGGANSPSVKYFNKLTELSNLSTLNSNQRYLLEELKLYGESIMPSDDDL